MDGEGQYVILTNLSEIASAELVDIAGKHHQIFI